jgi:hypothetical protein
VVWPSALLFGYGHVARQLFPGGIEVSSDRGLDEASPWESVE